MYACTGMHCTSLWPILIPMACMEYVCMYACTCVEGIVRFHSVLFTAVCMYVRVHVRMHVYVHLEALTYFATPSQECECVCESRHRMNLFSTCTHTNFLRETRALCNYACVYTWRILRWDFCSLGTYYVRTYYVRTGYILRTYAHIHIIYKYTHTQTHKHPPQGHTP